MRRPVNRAVVPDWALPVGFWPRLWARLLDFLIVSVPFAIAAGLLVAAGRHWLDAVMAIAIPLALVGAVYEVVFVAVWGRTPGKHVLKLVVITVGTGAIPGWQRSLARWGAHALFDGLIGIAGRAFVFPLLVVYGWLIADPLHQGLHDKAAGTLVARRQAAPAEGRPADEPHAPGVTPDEASGG